MTQAAQQATMTTPIVMSTVADPVGSGLVASLARPGGNVTGLTVMSPDLAGKQFQLLKEVVPKVSRVAFLRNPDNPSSSSGRRPQRGLRQHLHRGRQCAGSRSSGSAEAAA